MSEVLLGQCKYVDCCGVDLEMKKTGLSWVVLVVLVVVVDDWCCWSGEMLLVSRIVVARWWLRHSLLCG